MTNSKLIKSPSTKRKGGQNTKYFLIILSILGLLFSYSCKCRNNAQDSVPTGLSVSEDSGNIKKLIKTTTGYNSEVKILFNANNTESANFTATLNSVEDTDTVEANKITKDEITYTQSDGKVVFQNSVFDTGSSKVTETKKDITLDFKISKGGKSTNISIVVSVQKAKKLDGTVIQTKIKQIVNIQIGSFLFPTDSAGDTKLTTQNSGKVNDTDKISPAAF